MDVDDDVRSQGPSWQWIPVTRRRCLDDEFFEEGDIICGLARKHQLSEEDEELKELLIVVPEFPCQVSNCNQVFDTIVGYEMHYNSAHRHVCATCHRTFPNSHLLDVHLLEWHDTMFEILASKQNMFQCLVEECPNKFKDSKSRKNHMIQVHKFPSNFRYERPKSSQKSSKQKKSKVTVSIPSSTEPRIAASTVDAMEMELTGVDSTCSDTQIKSNEVEQPPGRKFSYKVPNHICFGTGASRGFYRVPGNKKKSKHWHQKKNEGKDTTVNIEEVDMTDLSQALNT